ncbi:MAG: alpha/beta fold hydrolase [Actinobacteria bacterium]|nr:alpha/beta fold hydrolase [Actinomycetota bacterium]
MGRKPARGGGRSCRRDWPDSRLSGYDAAVSRTGDAGVEIFWERSGAGEPLLLIQGMSGTHVSWGEPFLSHLRPDFDCVVFDNRGIGNSAEVEGHFTIGELAADALAVMDAAEFATAHMLGISMGGMVAQELALAHPDRIRTLTLGCTYSGGPGSSLIAPEDAGPLLEAMSSGNLDLMLNAMYAVNLSPTFRADEAHFADFTAMAKALPARQQTVQLQLGAIGGHDTQSRLAEITSPTLVIHGTEDKMIPVANGELIASLIPGARLEILEGVGHMFWWEQPERSAGLIREHALGA